MQASYAAGGKGRVKHAVFRQWPPLQAISGGPALCYRDENECEWPSPSRLCVSAQANTIRRCMQLECKGRQKLQSTCCRLGAAWAPRHPPMLSVIAAICWSGGAVLALAPEVRGSTLLRGTRATSQARPRQAMQETSGVSLAVQPPTPVNANAYTQLVARPQSPIPKGDLSTPASVVANLLG